MARRPLSRSLALVGCVVGSVTSALLGVRMATGTSACGISGGCDVVQGSAWASPGGVPLPAWGIVFFAVAAVGLLRVRERWPRWLRAWMVLGGLVGGALLVLQLGVIGAVCPWCVCVDVAAIVLGGLSARGGARTDPWPRGFRPRLAYATTIVAIGLTPPLIVDLSVRGNERDTGLAPTTAPPQRPAVAARDGATTIVEFVDIQCPFCREQHARLAAILDELHGEAIDLQVHHVPLPRHELARDAARVACCGEEQGHGRAVLDALMLAQDISAAGCRSTASRVGLHVGQLDACLASERPDRRLDEDQSAAAAASLRSLPTCVIGGRRMEGLQAPGELREAIDAALRQAGEDCSG